MKYKLVALNVQITGKTFRKENKPVLDDSKLPKDQLQAAYKNGFIAPQTSKAKNPAEVIAEYQKAEAAAKKEAEAERIKKAEAAAKK